MTVIHQATTKRSHEETNKTMLIMAPRISAVGEPARGNQILWIHSRLTDLRRAPMAGLDCCAVYHGWAEKHGSPDVWVELKIVAVALGQYQSAPQLRYRILVVWGMLITGYQGYRMTMGESQPCELVKNG